MEEDLDIYLSKNVNDTLSLAKSFTRRLKSGDVVMLNGVMGAGKTTFVKGVAEALDIKDIVKSPSFLIIKEYRGLIDLVHIDMYRLKDNDLQFFDFEDFYDENNILLVEWNRSEFLDEVTTYYVDIKIVNNESREISIRKR